MSITNIVLTGGPCGGKSTGLSRISQELANRGYKVYVIPEAATDLIMGGIKPQEMNIVLFQEAILKLQLTKEEIYLKKAKEYQEKTGQKCIILMDRATIDAKSFLNEKEFKELMKLAKGFTDRHSLVKLRDYYDGVFHLVTAADGAEEYYTLGNNAARRETAEEARQADRNGIEAWMGHPHFRVIDNSTGFDEKINRLMKEIYSLLGEPIPNEIERKYLIKMPNIKDIVDKYPTTKTNIVQTYLKGDENVERRVRQRGLDGDYTYYYTEKIGKGLKRVEKENRISEHEYVTYLPEADYQLRPIQKDRYCFLYKNQYIELDIYPFWGNYAIVEVELTDENNVVELPPEFEIVKEVTEDNNFKNHSLANNNYPSYVLNDKEYKVD